MASTENPATGDMESDPAWADPGTSTRITILLPKGEGSRLEFKECFPKQARALGQEIAALASSEGGDILLGVDDDGTAVGLQACLTHEGRLALCERIEGVLRTQVRPAVRPDLKFAAYDGLPILVIAVPRGTRPMYYCENVPYIRNITESRPATPEEVEEACRQHEAREPLGEGVSDVDESLSHLLGILVRVVVDTGLILREERQVNPWLDEFRYDCEGWFSELIEACANDLSDPHSLRGDIESVSEQCNRIAGKIRDLGSSDWDELKRDFHALHSDVTTLRDRILSEIPIEESFGEHATKMLAGEAYKLSTLVGRTKSEDYLFRNTEDIQAQSAKIGRRLLILVEYRPDRPQLSTVESAANELSAIETLTLCADGGMTIRNIRATLESAHDNLNLALELWHSDESLS